MTERESFEQFAVSKEWSITRLTKNGKEYLWPNVQIAWEAWQAGITHAEKRTDFIIEGYQTMLSDLKEYISALY